MRNARKWQKGFYELHAAMREACIKFPSFMTPTQELLYSNQLLLGRSSDNEEMVSYSDKDNQRYHYGRRTKTTLGRFLSRKMGIGETSTYFTANVFAALNGESTRFKVIKGDAIKQAYRDCVGGTSCMTGGCSEYVLLYAENSDKISMLTYVNGDKTCRALLWDCDDGIRYMDRIYPDDCGNHIQLFREWANRNNYDFRRYQGAPHDDCVYTHQENTLSVSLKAPSNGYYPYMDTFCWGDSAGNFRSESEDAERIFNCTGGGWSNSGTYCVCCEEYYHEGNMIYSRGDDAHICQDCYDEHYFTCNHCNNVFGSDDCHGDEECLCRSCFEDLYRECDCCNDFVRRNTVTETADESYVCITCTEEYYACCPECDELYHFDDLNEDSICKYCAVLIEEEEAA